MTDRHAAYLVVLEKNIREDDAEEGVLTALRMVRGVASVDPVMADIDQQIGQSRADIEWRDKILRLLR